MIVAKFDYIEKCNYMTQISFLFAQLYKMENDGLWVMTRKDSNADYFLRK